MKQKYLILKSNENNELIIREFAEQSKEMFLLICNETYDSKIIELSMAIDKQHLISALRTRNFYPPEIYTDKIAESVMAVYGAENNQPVELLIDDAALLAKTREGLKAVALTMFEMIPFVASVLRFSEGEGKQAFKEFCMDIMPPVALAMFCSALSM